MTASSAIPLLALLLIGSLTLWSVRCLVRVRERADGAPSLPLVRSIAPVNILFAGVLVFASSGYGGRTAVFAHLWRHDAWSALLFGALAGLLLHVLGGGSPLPIASLAGGRRGSINGTRDASLGTVVLFMLGEIGGLIIWFG
ncbi:MAG TPA: hypothetical protein VK821_16270, partial [Dehalococcoidia bacterium]|nr:hypothetical protein [Dehalococcoidia bacterium]